MVRKISSSPLKNKLRQAANKDKQSNTPAMNLNAPKSSGGGLRMSTTMPLMRAPEAVRKLLRV
jgi:hypothetical protein